MYRILTALMGIIFFFSSCQKELSVEKGQPAEGSLQNSLGECLPKNVKGSYVVSQSLTDSNYLEVTIDVVKAGTYTVFTDTVNGYSFKGEGKVSSPGSYIVRLPGKGKPLAEGTDEFSVFFDSSLCFVNVTVIAGGSSGGTSAYNLGTGGACTAATVGGTYTTGTALGSANKVSLTVTVSTVGTWTISTPSVTGISFSGAGTFTATGPQTIALTGSGTPTTSGSQTFMITAGSSSCSFTVPVTGGTIPPPASGVYFPLTPNSWWSYDDGAGSDTIKTTNTGPVTKGSNTYQQFISVDESGGADTAFYRKDAANSYYEYVSTADFVALGFGFTQPGIEILFLKDALTTNATWNSDFPTTLAGFPVTLRFKFTCINANLSLTVNGKNFTNVYHIKLQPQIGAAGTFSDSGGPIDFYYAKDIGAIRYTDGTDSQDIRYWKIN